MATVGALVALAGCGGGGLDGPAPQARLGPDGMPLPQVYRIEEADAAEVKVRLLDGVNALRQGAGLGFVTYSRALDTAAASHSRDMARQNRPWHFGSDGSSPLDRARRVGYPGLILGEAISETYETELETLAAWMQQPDTRAVILDPRARELGFAWHQEPAGKLWWTLVLGSTAIPAPAPSPIPAAVTTE
ncbi:lipoprotein, putative [Oceanicola granulosus HTCC2516]|uniref:Lipoprotein, putative n=1 Tax=Oceanicola granulosus (strain ATCC BAA-861 / DSM 15982 / KCTC 12143 / HTCC2516) TaxID=314256 RepID=Q2CJR7_OCEGH|nr:lipoprotein, putative [Oceanicola granulosus HTCC2516]